MPRVADPLDTRCLMNNEKRSQIVTVGNEWGGGPSLDMELFYADRHQTVRGWEALMAHPGILGPCEDSESLRKGVTLSQQPAASRFFDGELSTWYCYCAVVNPLGNGRSIGAESSLRSPKWLRGGSVTRIIMSTCQVEYVIGSDANLDEIGNHNTNSCELLQLYARLVELCRDVYRIAPFQSASVQPELLFEHEIDWSEQAYITVPLDVATAIGLPRIGSTSLHGILAV